MKTIIIVIMVCVCVYICVVRMYVGQCVLSPVCCGAYYIGVLPLVVSLLHTVPEGIQQL